ncbi:MAG: SDR family oxidoreductase [Pseudomonadota bacterium]
MCRDSIGPSTAVLALLGIRNCHPSTGVGEWSSKQSMGKLAHKVVFITGGANGAGSASVRLFCQQGAQVAVVDRDLKAGLALQAEMAEQGHDVLFCHGDVSLEADSKRSFDEVMARFGRVDVLFNHAGVIIVKPFLEHTVEEWDELLNNNARSAFLITRLVLPGMLERGKGVMVFTSTTGVKAATHMESIYCASKAAMHQLARSIAVEYRDQGIRANAICPSFVRTQHGEHEIEQLREYGILASEGDVNIMQGRICEPEEIANVALFLASEDSSFVNGAELFVDNTFTAV